MKVPFLDLRSQYQGIKNEVEPEVLKVFESCAYIGGPYVQKFEQEAAEYLHVKHAMGCSSGTAALVLALRACNVKPGDEVITTPFTFFATAEAIASVGAVPVFVDVKESDYTIDPAKIEEQITEKTKAILPVHIFGEPCDMDPIMEIAEKHNLKVIEDAAQGIGSSYKGRMVGTLGHIACFSFYPTKNLGGCGDGGMVTTNDDDLAVNVKALKEHGAGQNGAKALEILEGISETVSTTEQVTDLYNPYKYYNYLIAYNSRLDALQACVLSIKLKHLEEYNGNRAKVAARYIEKLPKEIIRPVYDPECVTCWHQFVVRSEYKQELCDYLAKNDVGCGTFYPVPMHKQKAFQNVPFRTPKEGLPISEMICSQSVCLPIFPELTEEQVQYVIDVICDFYKEKA